MKLCVRLNDIVDCVIREPQVRPVYGRQGTRVAGVECYILGRHGLD